MKKPTRHNLTRNSETCQEKSPKKPDIFNNKAQIENNSDNLFYECMFAIHGGDSITYEPQWIDAVQISQEYLIERIDDLIGSNTYCQRRVFAFIFAAKKTLNKVYFSIDTIADALNMCYRTVSSALRVLEGQGLISRVSGKRKHRTNLYFVKPVLFIKEFRKVIKKHLKIISDFAHKAWIQQLPTTLRKIILRIVNTYNNYFNSNQNTVMSSTKSEAIHFFRRKREKVRASVCMISHQDSIPPGTVTSKKKGRPESNVISSQSMPELPINAILKENVVKVVADFEKKKVTMPTDALRVLADLENEALNKEQRSSRPFQQRICPEQLADLKRSISYHFGGSYVHKSGDRLFDKSTTTYLRKKYSL